MAIVNCPECKVEVSDKAKSCPKCAYPINSENSVSIIDKKKGMSFTNWITVVFSVYI
jgi:predicted amidophosphoribosyltransferase